MAHINTYGPYILILVIIQSIIEFIMNPIILNRALATSELPSNIRLQQGNERINHIYNNNVIMEENLNLKIALK